MCPLVLWMYTYCPMTAIDEVSICMGLKLNDHSSAPVFRL